MTDARAAAAGALARDLRRILYFPDESPNLDFYVSALTDENPRCSTHEMIEWLAELNSRETFRVSRIPFSELRRWAPDPATGDLQHDSGAFFAIRGLRVRTNVGPVPEWTQPIIDQGEIGVLGMITKKIDGVLQFLVQAKAEPGNITTYQISPTVQATRSNYRRRHGGKPTRYIEYFLEPGRARVLVDQLQSEQGARFYSKRNRNVIVRVPDDEPIEPGPLHRWLTLGQIHRLAQHDNTVNMDTRSVVSAIHFGPHAVTSLQPVDRVALRDCLGASPFLANPPSEYALDLVISAHPNTVPLHAMDELQRRITAEKFECEIDSRIIPLNDVTQWRKTESEILHEEGKFFSVIAVRVEADDREVESWDQPIIQQHQPGLVGFMTRRIDGVTHFLTQLKMESGVMDLLEVAPTVQCITGSYEVENRPRFVDDFLNAVPGDTVLDVMQSEEGGRFFHESNRNVILHDEEKADLEVPRYTWMSLYQLKWLLNLNNFLNVEARSLLACLRMH